MAFANRGVPRTCLIASPSVPYPPARVPSRSSGSDSSRVAMGGKRIASTLACAPTGSSAPTGATQALPTRTPNALSESHGRFPTSSGEHAVQARGEPARVRRVHREDASGHGKTQSGSRDRQELLAVVCLGASRKSARRDPGVPTRNGGCYQYRCSRTC